MVRAGLHHDTLAVLHAAQQDFLKADKLIAHIDFRGVTKDGDVPQRAHDGDCVRAYYMKLVPHRPGSN